MKKYTFEAIIKSHPDYPNAAYVAIPLDVETEFGKKRVKVIAHIDGVRYQGSIMRMGTPYHILGIIQDIRKQIGKTHGDMVSIELQEDTAPRTVEIPELLQAAFAKYPDAKDFFDTLSYTNQKEYVRWITSAKREATRENRLEQTIEKLLAEKKNPTQK
jgi:hypothetical protein